MSFIFEQPFWVGFIGLILTLVLAGVWAFAGQRLAGIAALVALGLTAALVFVGTAVETDREAIRRTLAQNARDVESNDINAVLSHVASSAPSIATEASNELPRYQFEAVEVKWQMLEIDVCAQHNNGGLVVDAWWQSNVAGFFPVGEAAGAFGRSTSCVAI